MMVFKIFVFILFVTLSSFVFAQKVNLLITGVVKSEAGKPLSRVNVSVNNNAGSVATQTDTTGFFSLKNLPDGGAPYHLIFECGGFETQTLNNYLIREGALSAMVIKMKPLANVLNEVLVVGYGKSLKKELSSSITSLNSSDLNSGVISTPEQLMQGHVAGLNISQDGNPNGVAQVILRGPSTLNLGQQPFYVIDDVPDADLSLISPADISSIEVLKDASAAAIYGNRGANGVILINTQKGKPGNLKLTYNGYDAIQAISGYIEVATAQQLRDYLKANHKALAPADDVGGNTNWQKEVSRLGNAQNHNISFSGGDGRTVYSTSLNYFNNNAIIRGSSLERFAGRFSLEQKAMDNHVKLKVSMYDLVSNQYDVDTLVFYNVLRFLPTLNVYNADGTFKEDLTRTQTYNPVALIANNQFNTKLNSFLGNGGIEADLPFGILYNLNVAYQSVTTNSNAYYNHYSLLAYNANGAAVRSSYQDTKRVVESFFSYDHTLGSNQYFKFLLGYSWQQNSNGDGFQSSNVNFVSDATSYYNLGLGQAPAGYVPLYGDVSIKTLRLISFYSRVNYNYQNKYLLQGSLRRDGSSAFGVNNKWGYFPAISAAWRIIEEPFMKQQNTLNDLKIRAGYGVAGNTIGFDPLTPLLLYNSTGSFYYNGSFIKSIGPTQNPNPNLKWEKTAQLDVGIDFGLFRNRLSGAIDVYNKTTTNIIYNYQEPASLSYAPGSLIYANAGEMNNKGIEFVLNAVPVKTKHLLWNLSFNLAHNQNRIVSLSNDTYKLSYIYTGYPSGTGQSNVSTQILIAGHPVGQFYTLHYLGKNTNGVSTFEDKQGNPTTTPKSTDQQYLGSAQPKFTFGFGNTLKWHNLDLNIFIRGVTGNKILNATLATLNSPGDASNHNIPRLTLSESYNDYNANLYSDRYLENGSYLRLDNATLGYNFNNTGRYVKSVRIYLTGTDLFTITKYTGIDPEMNLGTITPGIDNHSYYPKTRSFIAGVKLEL
ncbi:SusC/RagA family TonB-linked outer membrane protein [Mucilaginibacter paludis]|uniref:TonB-dependent receptor n=1 Tax=Mucilaginibacter paludis DSM 18603 TaxID=714943 RepID=H1YAI6_9SPHI|nr:SusC/RagA family TonB-linked outer membrane protein [Mucilaginibacter paludis]EHQ29106.1 TonB-dependent receptor [Mucilaginibacter paludis DSM 18603]